MGKELFSKYTSKIDEANSILNYDVVNLCLREEKRLNNTLYTQPALYIVNALHFWEIEQGKRQFVDYHIGHSLGEYNALLASKVFDFATGLKLVKKRAELMSKAKGGGMAAVLGMEKTMLETLLKESGDRIDIANYNSPGQFVISGKKEDVVAIEKVLTTKGASRVIPLTVSGAFHSRYMKEAGEEFRAFLDNFEFETQTVPVIANVDAKPYDLASLKDRLAAQIYNSVQWIDTIYSIKQEGREFIEIGPGRVLTGLYRRFK